MDVNERIFRYLAQVPPAVSGNGGHNQTFALACSLYNGFALTVDQVMDYLRMYNDRCQPPWSEAELAHKAQQAANAQHSKPRGHLIGDGNFSKDDFKPTSFPARAHVEAPKIDPVTAIEVWLKGFSCTEAQLTQASPVTIPKEFELHGILMLNHAYRAGEVVNFVTEYRNHEGKDGTTKAIPYSYGESVERDELISIWELDGMPQSEAGGWLRMNPMTGNGISDKDVAAHRYILLEFDSIPAGLQISLLARLPLPIAAILTSGGRSVHAWVRADCPDLTSYKDDSTMLLRHLERFGVDGKNKNPSRLSRLPGVVRKIGGTDGGQQRLVYLNPNPTQKAIL